MLPEEIVELVNYGILCTHDDDGSEYFDGDDYQLLTIAKEFLDQGVDSRNLQMFLRFADREADLFGSMVAPLVRQKNPEAREKAEDTLTDLSRAATRLRQALLRNKLRPFLNP